MPVNTIFSLFAKSPIAPIEAHIAKVHECCALLVPFFEAVNAKDWDKAVELRGEITRIEKEADVLKREIRLKLPKGLFMPVAREDLLELVTQQDKIANRAKNISGLILGREMSFPAEMNADFTTYLQRCIDATAQAEKAIEELDDLLETGFRGRYVELVEKMVHELDLIEDDTDQMQVALRKKLRAFEFSMNPVDVVFLYKVLELVGDLADQAERVGARLELMLSRS